MENYIEIIREHMSKDHPYEAIILCDWLIRESDNPELVKEAMYWQGVIYFGLQQFDRSAFWLVQSGKECLPYMTQIEDKLGIIVKK